MTRRPRPIACGCRSITVEDLDFVDARQVGRETLGRGRRGKRFRRTVAGIPTLKLPRHCRFVAWSAMGTCWRLRRMGGRRREGGRAWDESLASGLSW